ncbi:MAG: tyrosine-type recombinase/integrase [Solirubrobacterales bacterium]|nr:tyrosine-type recombinase/integrase [Solirubrobacterales bacterium]
MAALDPARLAPDPEIAELAQDFLEAQRSPRTRRSYRTDLALFFKWLAERELHPLKATRPDIDRFRNYLAELVGPDGKPSPSGCPRYAPTTVSRRLATVRSFYGYLTERRALPASPAANIKGPRLSRDPKGRGMTEEQLKALIAAGAAHSHDAHALVCLLALNGLRVSEVCGAQLEDVVSEPGGGHSLIVHGKGGREDRVALNIRTERAVLAVAGDRRSGPLVRRKSKRPSPGRPPLVPFTQQAAGELLVELGHTAGLLGERDETLDRLHPHRLRHTFITLLLDKGVDLPTVQDSARHASSDMTRRYDRSRASFREHPTHLLTFE